MRDRVLVYQIGSLVAYRLAPVSRLLRRSVTVKRRCESPLFWKLVLKSRVIAAAREQARMRAVPLRSQHIPMDDMDC